MSMTSRFKVPNTETKTGTHTIDIYVICDEQSDVKAGLPNYVKSIRYKPDYYVVNTIKRIIFYLRYSGL